MKVEIYHASVFGNGAKVAEELRRLLELRGNQVSVHHIRDVDPKTLPAADLHVFVSPTRLGKPIREMRGFVKKVRLPAGARYAVLATHGAPQPNKKTGQMPTEEDLARYYRTIDVIDERLKANGMVKVADTKVFVQNLKGPLEDGWEKKVEAFAAKLSVPS